MTQEEKAKAYDERLAKARKEYSIHEANNAIGIMDALERVFPELKESEDERVRKDIIAYIETANQILPQFQKDKWISSLKDKVQPQQKRDKGKEKEIFFSEWSEEDELHIRELESLVKQVWTTAEHENDKDTIHKMSDLSFFLKTLKPQPKQKWDEEDERILNTVIHDLRYPGVNYYKKPIEEKVEWLKSLKGRYTWKPSEKQINVLKFVIKDIEKDSLIYPILNSILEQLKKLREE